MMVSYIQSSLNFIFTEIVKVLNIKFLLSQKYNSKQSLSLRTQISNVAIIKKFNGSTAWVGSRSKVNWLSKLTDTRSTCDPSPSTPDHQYHLAILTCFKTNKNIESSQ